MGIRVVVKGIAVRKYILFKEKDSALVGGEVLRAGELQHGGETATHDTARSFAWPQPFPALGWHPDLWLGN